MTGNGGRTLYAHHDHNMSAVDAPSKTVTQNTHGDGTILVNDRHSPASPASPSPTLGAKARGQAGEVLDFRATIKGHPTAKADRPSPTVRGGGEGHSAPEVLMEAKAPKRVGQGNRVGNSAAAACTVTAKPARVGAGESHVLDWPWGRPSTTIQRDERIPPPGHHDEYSTRSMPNAVVLSELAATILQGFPESWNFCGATKAARWSQLGQAMPPPLAHAVATSVVEQLARTESKRKAVAK